MVHFNCQFVHPKSNLIELGAKFLSAAKIGQGTLDRKGILKLETFGSKLRDVDKRLFYLHEKE
jgi:hypothetical protein